jgi:hypothetical protein
MTGPEVVKFSTAVSSAFNAAELTSLLLGLDRNFLDYVPAHVPFPEQVLLLVGVANSQGWISQLVLAAINDRPNNQAIRTFLVLYPDWDPTTNIPFAHPCDTLHVFGGKSFIGRAALRKYLKLMSTVSGKKVLLVSSDKSKQGKTYTKELVDFFSTHTQPSRLVYVDMDTCDYEPGDLARHLAKRMGVNTNSPEQAEQQVARWIPELANWVVPDVSDEKIWWVVLDGFDAKVTSEGTRELISQLAQRIQSKPNYRLVLINYYKKYRLPLAVDAFVFRDAVKPIQEKEIELFLSEVHKQRYGKPPTPEKLQEYFVAVDARLTAYKQEYPDDAEDQLLVNMAVTEVAELV